MGCDADATILGISAAKTFSPDRGMRIRPPRPDPRARAWALPPGRVPERTSYSPGNRDILEDIGTSRNQGDISNLRIITESLLTHC